MIVIEGKSYDAVMRQAEKIEEELSKLGEDNKYSIMLRTFISIKRESDDTYFEDIDECGILYGEPETIAKQITSKKVKP